MHFFSIAEIDDCGIVSAPQTDIWEDIYKRIYSFPHYQEAFIQIQKLYLSPRGNKSTPSLFECLFLLFFG